MAERTGPGATRTPAVLADAPGAPLLDRSGYDHSWLPWQTPAERPGASWPHGARTAVSIVVHLSAAEWEDARQPFPAPVGGRGVTPAPDVPRMSHREFGHRVGVFRLLRLLETAGIGPAVVIDVLTAEHYRPLLDHILPVAGEVLAGGLSASRPITSAMGEQEERDYIRQSLDRLAAAVGRRPAGWLGPGHAESARTPGLLAEAGVDYLTDWANDDLPYPMTGAGLWSFPLSWELSDLSCVVDRDMAPWTWSQAVIEAFDVLHAEGGRMLALHLQPWLSGQAFRAEAVAAVLDHLSAIDDVWFAPPGAIIERARTDDVASGEALA